jgi:hypothetical protein
MRGQWKEEKGGDNARRFSLDIAMNYNILLHIR